MPTVLDIAQYRADYGDHMDGEWGVVMVVMMVLFALAIGAFIFWVVRNASVTPSGPAASAQETPMQILDRRLAQGEIAADEYKERAAILGGR